MINDFEVFDFKKEDEISGSEADKFSAKFKTPNSDEHTTFYRQFLEKIPANYNDFRRKEKDGSPRVDVNAIDGDYSCDGSDEPFEGGCYPKDDVDAVSISKRDVDLLQPEKFINDTIIDFYIKYLENRLQPEERQRFHFFNCFFFRKLADNIDPSSTDASAAFLRVRRWTMKLDMFGKDYIFIPVNFNLHWSLLVICYLGEIASIEDEDLVNSLKVPCILHMDSIEGYHAGLKSLVRSYLWEEWKEKHKETSEDLSSKFSNLQFVSLKLPQQENSFDSGLFLLHYLELFLVEALKTTNFSSFVSQLNSDWFQPTEPCLKRILIQKLILKLLETNSSLGSPDNNSSKKRLKI